MIPAVHDFSLSFLPYQLVSSMFKINRDPLYTSHSFISPANSEKARQSLSVFLQYDLICASVMPPAFAILILVFLLFPTVNRDHT